MLEVLEASAATRATVVDSVDARTTRPASHVEELDIAPVTAHRARSAIPAEPVATSPYVYPYPSCDGLSCSPDLVLTPYRETAHQETPQASESAIGAIRPAIFRETALRPHD